MATFSYDPSFSATETSQPLVRTVVMGDAYEQRIQLGLQRDPKTWRLSFNNRDDTERDNILSFLEARKGTDSFDWTPPNESSSGKYVCLDWTKQINVAGYATITATFEQVFEA